MGCITEGGNGKHCLRAVMGDITRDGVSYRGVERGFIFRKALNSGQEI